MIEVSELSKVYGNKRALDGVSFSVKQGEILGLLGVNGAGKSTMMNIITGYLSSTSGTVTVDGIDILERPKEAKRKIGYLPEQPPLYPEMTVREYLEFVFDLKKVKGYNKSEHLLETVRKIGIEEVLDRRISNLSKGYKQRVGLAQALLGNPEILILDEPTVGLDPKQIIEIRSVIQELGNAHTVILSSHILSEVSAVCERVIIINHGKIVAEDTPENLARTMRGAARLRLNVLGDEAEARAALAILPKITAVRAVGQKEDGVAEFELQTEQAADTEFLKKLFAVLAEKNLPILLLKPVETSLEEIFLALTTGDELCAEAETTEEEQNGESNMEA